MVLKIPKACRCRVTTILEWLARYRQVEMQLAIYDFGAGWSSLACWKKLDIDYPKSGRSFIGELRARQEEQVITDAIVVMAQRPG